MPPPRGAMPGAGPGRPRRPLRQRHASTRPRSPPECAPSSGPSCVVSPGRPPSPTCPSPSSRAASLQLLVETPRGYRHLSRLAPQRSAIRPRREGRRPCVSWDDLEEHAADLCAARARRRLAHLGSLLDRASAALPRTPVGRRLAPRRRREQERSEPPGRRPSPSRPACPSSPRDDVRHARPDGPRD